MPVDHEHTAHGDRVPRPGDPVRIDDEVIVHFDVGAGQRPPGVARAQHAGMESDATQLDVAVMGPELLVLDLLVVEGLAQHEEVAGGKADAELHRPDGEGGNPIVFPHGTPFDVHHGPVVVRRV